MSVSNRYRAKETHNKVDSRLHLRVIHENGTVHLGVGADVAAHARRTVAVYPLVDDPDVGRELLAAVRDRDLVVYVGHIERCNPAIIALQDVMAVGAADGDRVVASLEFADGLVASLTASRVTQERVRDLAVTVEDCHVDIDYMDQSVQIHRHSLPEYIATNGDVRYRHESVIERPTVETGEPLRTNSPR